MSRRVLAVSLVLAGLVLADLVLAGCGDDQPDAAPASTPSPTQTATASSSPSASPTAQPTGSDGVTVELSDYAKYSGEPAVRSWTQTMEAIAASTNLRQVLPRVTDRIEPDLRRQVVATTQQAWRNDWNVRPVTNARLESLSGDARDKTLVACLWGPSYGYYQADGTYYGDPQVYWMRLTFDLVASGTEWNVQSVKSEGKCPGGAPQ